MRSATGSGTQRLYGFRDILVLKAVKRARHRCLLQQIRVAIDHLRERGVDDLTQITLMSDGASVYECTSADEVIDLVQGGQGSSASPSAACGARWRGSSPSCPASGPRTSSRPSTQTTSSPLAAMLGGWPERRSRRVGPPAPALPQWAWPRCGW